MKEIIGNVMTSVMNSHHLINNDNSEVEKDLNDIFEYILSRIDDIVSLELLTGIIYAHFVMYFSDISVNEIRNILKKEF